MRSVVPFIAQLTTEEENAWLANLRVVLPDYHLLRLEELTQEQCKLVEVAVVANPDPQDLAALPNLKWVQSLWAGVERLMAETRDASFAIVRMTDPQLAKTMAEAVLAWTLYLHRDMPRYRTQQTAQIWHQHPLPLASQRTVGVMGLGNLGQAASNKLVQQGFKVCGWSRSSAELAAVEAFQGEEGLTQMLHRTHILVCLLPLTASTLGLLNHHTLGQLPQNAALINFARGPILDTDALIAHLDTGHLSHAVLDVFTEEPLPPQSPLWRHPGITVLPHISAPTNKQTAARIVATNLNQFFAKREIPPSVDRILGY